MKCFYNFILLLTVTANCFPQAPEIEWENTIGGYRNDFLFDIQNTNDGGYVLAGFSYSDMSGDKSEDNTGRSDYWVVKLDVGGNIEWQRTYGGNSYDNLWSIQQTSDNGYILGGHSESGVSGDKTLPSKGEDDYWVIKLNTEGNIEWQKTYGGSRDDFLYVIKQTTDGGYILDGSSWSPISGDKTVINWPDSEDSWIIKIDESGNIEWQKSFGGNGSDRLQSCEQTTDGGYILGGQSSSGISGNKTEESYGTYDYWAVKLNSTGNIEWQNTINGNYEDNLNSISQTSDGEYILGGWSNSGADLDKIENTKGDKDYWVIKLGTEGDIVWQNTIGGSANDYLLDIFQVSEGNYILSGWSASGVSADKTEPNIGGQDLWIIRLNSTGDIEWQNTIGGSGAEYIYNSTWADDGGYVLGGYSDSETSGDKVENSQGRLDYWIVKLFPEMACEVPAGIYCDNITSTIVTIHWDAIADATKYQINYRPVGGGAWLKKNSLMNGKNLTGLIPNTNYEYKIKTVCGAEASPFSSLFNFTTLPLKEAGENFKLEIYPNPASDEITVLCPKSSVHSLQSTVGDASIIITNISGKIIYQNELIAEETTIDISNYASGIYFAKVIIEGNTNTKKIIIEH